MKITSLKNMTAGDKVTMVTRRSRLIECIFLGFSDDQEQYGKPGPVFASFAALKKAKGYASFAEMDYIQRGLDSDGRAYGYGIYAWFQEVDKDGRITTFPAYRYEGGWAIGSGAERISLEAK